MNFNILGIGLPQLILVFGLAMILFGPKKMIQYAYQAGRWVSQMRVMWEEAAKNVQKEFHEAGLDLPTDLPIRGGRIDIGAAAMRIVEQASTPPVRTATPPISTADAAGMNGHTPFTTLAEAPHLPPPDATAATSGAASPLTMDAAPVTAPTAPPSLDYPTDTPDTAPRVEQDKKYDAWLPD